MFDINFECFWNESEFGFWILTSAIKCFHMLKEKQEEEKKRTCCVFVGYCLVLFHLLLGGSALWDEVRANMVDDLVIPSINVINEIAGILCSDIDPFSP